MDPRIKHTLDYLETVTVPDKYVNQVRKAHDKIADLPQMFPGDFTALNLGLEKQIDKLRKFGIVVPPYHRKVKGDPQFDLGEEKKSRKRRGAPS